MFKKILVPLDIDYPEIAAIVYQNAAKLAEQNDAELKLVNVMPGFGMPIVSSFISEELKTEILNGKKQAMEDFIQKYCKKSVDYVVLTGKNWEEILHLAEHWPADLIVVYHNYQHDLNEVFSGSCSKRVAEHANCSVLWLRNIEEEFDK